MWLTDLYVQSSVVVTCAGFVLKDTPKFNSQMESSSIGAFMHAKILILEKAHSSSIRFDTVPAPSACR